MSRTFELRILRFDPGRPQKPRYRSYAVQAEQRSTVLQLLEKVRSEHDGELSFRCSCGTGKCGCCAVRVNGRRVLACLHMAHGPTLTVEPVSGFTVIKDLMVALDETNSKGEAR